MVFAAQKLFVGRWKCQDLNSSGINKRAMCTARALGIAKRYANNSGHLPGSENQKGSTRFALPGWRPKKGICSVCLTRLVHPNKKKSTRFVLPGQDHSQPPKFSSVCLPTQQQKFCSHICRLRREPRSLFRRYCLKVCCSGLDTKNFNILRCKTWALKSIRVALAIAVGTHQLREHVAAGPLDLGGNPLLLAGDLLRRDDIDGQRKIYLLFDVTITKIQGKGKGQNQTHKFT